MQRVKVSDRTVPVMLTVAGSDPGGGAGIQADVKTAFANGVYCAAAVTCVTVQNSSRFAYSYPVDADIVRRQIEAVLEDHFSTKQGCRHSLMAVKIGMLANVEVVRAVHEALLPVAACVPIVLDPILAPTLGNGSGGCDDLNADMRREYADEIIRLSEMVALSTPNKAEHAHFIQYGGLRSQYILEKGGHVGADGESIDILYHKIRKDTDADHNMYVEVKKFCLPQIETSNSHGTGCVLSSAIAANLALGSDMEDAIERGKLFLHEKLEVASRIKFGVGSLSNYGPAFML